MVSIVKAQFLVVLGEQSYPVVVRYEPGDFIVEIKKLIIVELKSTRPNAFGRMDIDVDWLTLKTWNGDVILTDEIPEGNKFLAELALDQAIGGKAFLTLTDDKLKSWGLSALGKREELLALSGAENKLGIVVDVFPRGPELDCSSSDVILQFLESEMLDPSKTNSRPHILLDQSLDFTMVGREDAIRVAQDCFKSIIDAWWQRRTDIVFQFAQVFLDQGKLVCWRKAAFFFKKWSWITFSSVIVPYFNGFSPQAVEACMSIQESFS
eukprot:TRINITY_DN27545_c0_g1_i3.p1 TRINITY_DN27545_c0_g1~~TRINITY_DN27545_c0_g1_i3.p1  ORF type:complete len:266 (-),score=62.33 TRINITY_DN27545_c0_g1_i3:205-1002(-)